MDYLLSMGSLFMPDKEDLVINGWRPLYQGEADLTVSSSPAQPIEEAEKSISTAHTS